MLMFLTGPLSLHEVHSLVQVDPDLLQPEAHFRRRHVMRTGRLRTYKSCSFVPTAFLKIVQYNVISRRVKKQQKNEWKSAIAKNQHVHWVFLCTCSTGVQNCVEQLHHPTAAVGTLRRPPGSGCRPHTDTGSSTVPAGDAAVPGSPSDCCEDLKQRRRGVGERGTTFT